MTSTDVSTASAPAGTRAEPADVPMLVDAPHVTGTPSGALLPALPGHPQLAACQRTLRERSQLVKVNYVDSTGVPIRPMSSMNLDPLNISLR